MAVFKNRAAALLLCVVVVLGSTVWNVNRHLEKEAEKAETLFELPNGIEEQVENRIGKKTMGFGAEIRKSGERASSEIMAQVKPEDLLKFGLIPEFVGRLPVMITLSPLDEEALVRILTEPKNALVRQYRKMLDMDGVELEFTENALRAVAQKALKRKSGARGLRAIIEETMMDAMYEIPSIDNVVKCVVTEESVAGSAKPELIMDEAAESSVS